MNLTDRTTMVADGLSRCGRVTPTGHAAWRVSDRASENAVQAELRGDWLTLRRPIAQRPGYDVESAGSIRLGALLKANSTLAAGVKFVVLPIGEYAIAAELPCDDDSNFESRMVQQVQDLLAAIPILETEPAVHSAPADEASTIPTVDLSAGSQANDRLSTLARESGWPHQDRAGGPTFRLEAGEQFVPANLECIGDQAYRVRAALEAPAELGPDSRRACECLLLAACGVVRMVRVIDSSNTDSPRFAWEAGWSSLPSVVELRHALSALSVGVSLTCRELPLLADESLARQFLSVRGWSSPIRSSWSELGVPVS